MSHARDLGLVKKGRQFDELGDFMQEMEEENAALHAACGASKAARANSLLEVSTLLGGEHGSKEVD